MDRTLNIFVVIIIDLGKSNYFKYNFVRIKNVSTFKTNVSFVKTHKRILQKEICISFTDNSILVLNQNSVLVSARYYILFSWGFLYVKL